MPAKDRLWIAALMCGAAAVTLAGDMPGVPKGTIWVTERTPGASTVAAIDAATGVTLGITAVGSAPIGITVPRYARKAYSSDENADQLSVIDADSVTAVGTIPMGAGSRPHHLMATQNGRYIYVAEYGSNRIGIVDTQVDVNVADFIASSNASAKTHAVWIEPNGVDLYATNEGAGSVPGTFSKLDARTGAIVWEQAVGNRPSEVLVDGAVAYVSVRNDNVIRAFDVSGETPTFLGEAAANVNPDTLSLTNDKRTLIVGLRGTPARIGFVDTQTLTTTYLTLPGQTTGHQWLSRDGRFTFMALENPGAVAVVDNYDRALVTSYPYPNGLLRPHGVFYEPPRNQP